MAAFSAIAMAIGTGISLYGSMQQASAQKQMAAETKAAAQWEQNVKQQQMQLDTNRRQRQAIRQTIMARATAENVGANQGAQFGSGVAGGMAQAVSEGDSAINTASESQYLGQQFGKASMAMEDAKAKGASAMADAQGISSLGNAVVSLAPTIGRLGNYATGQNYA